jgi:glycosyltransferase involved in cell wall biosynthesis
MLLSIVICYHPDDKVYLPELLDCLPSEYEIILFENHVGEEEKENSCKEAGNIKEIDYTFDKMHYGNIRNKAKEYATGEWIYYIDADERPNPIFWDKITGVLEDSKDDIGGYAVWITSNHFDEKLVLIPNEMLRIIRNIPEIVFWFNVHENAAPSIHKNDMRVVQTTFKLDHLGYMKTDQEIMGKLDRNLGLLWQGMQEALDHDRLNETKYYIERELLKKFRIETRWQEQDRVGVIKPTT